MSDFTIAVSAIVVGGIIVHLLQRIIDGPIRDRLSIRKKHIENVGNDHTEDIVIKTSGPLSLKGRPVYIQNTGIIKNIIINEHQINNVVIVHKNESEAVLIPKNYNDSEINFQTTGSGMTTTVSGSLHVK